MRSGLFWKLFLLQVLAAGALLGGSLYATRAYSIRNFSEFIERRDAEQVRELADQLAIAYAQNPDLIRAAQSVPLLWRGLQLRPRRPAVVFGFARPEAVTPAPPPWRENAPPAAAPPAPTPEAEGDDELEGATPDDEPSQAREPTAGPLRIAPRPHGRRHPLRPGGPVPPLELLDANGRRVLGIPLGENAKREPIMVGERIVAYLAWPPLRRPPEQLEFERKEQRRHMIIWPVALAVATVFALLTTALIVKPIRRLSSGTAALARREFGTRVPEGRGDELGALARDFNRMAAALEGYDTRQRQWVADVSHELRTPVAVLRGELEAVLDGLRPADDAAIRSLREEVTRLEALIQDLHLVAVAESGGLRLHLAPTDLGALVQHSAERFRERLRAKGFELRVSGPAVGAAVGAALAATVDAQRIEQVLANLHENALRHANPPGPITVAARAEGSFAVLSVADGGPGVPPDTLPRLFDRLYRVDSARTRGNGGAGLGLAICKSIVEAHGGQIQARLSAAGGLEIVMRIPLQR